MTKIISLDTETTGIDFYHTARPFFVTSCDDQDQQTFWEWDVDPLTRLPQIPSEDLDEIHELLDSADRIVLHNSKFDAKALASIGLVLPWDKVEDTLIAGHVLASNQPHDLTSMVLHYLGDDIQPLEITLEKAVKKCRSMVQQAALKIKRGKVKKLDPKKLLRDNPLGRWYIAREDDPDMPSAKSDNKKVSNPWRFDYWLPRAMFYSGVFEPPNTIYDSVLKDYANADSAYTLPLWWVLERELKERKLWTIYREQMKLPPIIQDMEHRGVSISKKEAYALKTRLQEESDRANRICVNIATDMGHELVLPKGGNNKSLTSFCFDADKLNLPVVKKTDKGNPSLDKDAMELYLGTLPEKSKQLLFLQRLSAKRQRDTSVSYLESYERFWLPIKSGEAVPQTGIQGEELLDLEGEQVQGDGVRAISPNRGVPGTSSGVQTVQGGDTRGVTGSTQVRQESLCEPGTPVLGDSIGQYEGHDSEGKRRQGKRGTSSNVKADGRRCTGDKEDTSRVRRGAGSTGKTVQNVRSKSNSSVWHHQQEILEASTLNDWFVLHPNLNQTGSNTLRFSCSSPNEQNISKIGMKCLYCAGRGCMQCDGEGVGKESVRYAFGPAPGREWWSLDAKNIELRIPFYYSKEQVLIDLFERPDDPPFYGSNHLLNFSIVYYDIWEGELGKVCKVSGCKCEGKITTLETVGPHCKKKFAGTYYQWDKNGWFCKQYGGQRELTDATFRRPGAFDLLDNRLKGLTELNAQCIQQANRYGYVETLPDRSVDPERGYRIMCQRSEWGKVKPTIPLSYFVQGTAMWWTRRAMVRVEEQLREWRRKDPKWDGFMTMQVHDEIVLDLPKRFNPVRDRDLEKKGKTPISEVSNLWRIRVLQKLMSQGGDDIGIPIPVGCSFHPHNWGESVDL